ncbi:MAG: ribonuclease III [Desulfuromonadales bacterium]|nr:ribonuclease III [Desulfuromonadales bacterium]
MTPDTRLETHTDTLRQLQDSLAYRFTEHERVIQALTHPSFHNEQQIGAGDYQRLEFFGDAILGMLLAEILLARFPEAAEGELSRSRAQLAEQGTLAGIARSMGFGRFIRLGRGEELTGGRDKDSILADVVESLIAAVYLDGGLEAARRLVVRMFDDLLALSQEEAAARDSKSELQEALSARGLLPPEYRLAEESGPPHDRQFRFLVLIEGRVAGEGQGRSKKIAQQQAAGQALERLLAGGVPAV